MTELTADAAYLIKNGMPYDKVMAMPPGRQRAAARAMSSADKKVARSSPAARIGMGLAGILCIVLGSLLGLFIVSILNAPMP